MAEDQEMRPKPGDSSAGKSAGPVKRSRTRTSTTGSKPKETIKSSRSGATKGTNANQSKQIASRSGKRGKHSRAEIALRVSRILEVLDAEYPDATCSLNFANPFQLLIATILSAQCTDKRVNEVTQDLFQRYPDAEAFAHADLAELEEMIRPTGFFRNKARNIINCAQALVAEHRGEVPQTLEELIPLSGVGRKTANVVLGDAFGVPGIVVDTHAKRLSQRLGLTEEESPEKTEIDLMKVIPVERWTKFCHQLIAHGRAICTARSPKCEICPLQEDCDFGGGPKD